MAEREWRVVGDSSRGSLDDRLRDAEQHRTTDVTDVKPSGETQETDDFRRGNHTRPAVKPDTRSHTRLQDLPPEMLECILVRAVPMEVKSMKLAKVVWKEKAALVIRRLRTVCSQWNKILTTNFFRKEVRRILEDTAEETFQFEVLHEFPIKSSVIGVATTDDEIFILCRKGYPVVHDITVFDRNNMATEIKQSITLPDNARPDNNGFCSLSDCMYVLSTVYVLWSDAASSSVLRVAKDELTYSTSTLIDDLQLSHNPSLTASADGYLVLASIPDDSGPPVVRIYGPNGFLQHDIMLSVESLDVFGWRISRRLEQVVPKSNGNLIAMLKSYGDPSGDKLIEINLSGCIVRQCKSTFCRYTAPQVSFADRHGRICIADLEGIVDLVDSELNPLPFVRSRPLPRGNIVLYPLHFNGSRNEVVRIASCAGDESMLAIFRLTEK